MEKILVLQEIGEGDVITLLGNMESLAPCDVAVFMYDSSDEHSWQGASHLLGQVATHGENTGYKVPCLIVASKNDLDQSSLALQQSTLVSQDIGIETPINISVRLRDLNNIFCRIIQAAQQHHLSINKRTRLWYKDAETLFCTCYLDLLNTHEDAKMLTRQEKFEIIAQSMSKKSKRVVFTHEQLNNKFKKLRSLYKVYMSPNKKRSSDWWEKKELQDVDFRKIRRGESLPIFELLKKILEAEKSTLEDESESDCDIPLWENLMREVEFKNKECLEAQVSLHKINMELLQKSMHSLENQCATLDFENKDLKRKLSEEVKERKRLYGELVELKGGNSKTLTLVHISPSVNDVGETISSLNIATRVRGIEFGQVNKKNVGELQKLMVRKIKTMEEKNQSLEAKNKAKDKKIKELELQLLAMKTAQPATIECFSPPICSPAVVSKDKASRSKRITSIPRTTLQKKVIIKPTVTVQRVNKVGTAARGTNCTQGGAVAGKWRWAEGAAKRKFQPQSQALANRGSKEGQESQHRCPRD